MKPTPKQIDAEVKTLQEMLPRVIPFSQFGDDHHQAIRTQIEVLTHQWDYEEIDRRFGVEEDDRPRYEAAAEVIEWMLGNSEQPPSEDWKSLIKKDA